LRLTNCLLKQISFPADLFQRSIFDEVKQLT